MKRLAILYLATVAALCGQVKIATSSLFPIPGAQVDANGAPITWQQILQWPNANGNGVTWMPYNEWSGGTDRSGSSGYYFDCKVIKSDGTGAKSLNLQSYLGFVNLNTSCGDMAISPNLDFLLFQMQPDGTVGDYWKPGGNGSLYHIWIVGWDPIAGAPTGTATDLTPGTATTLWVRWATDESGFAFSQLQPASGGQWRVRAFTWNGTTATERGTSPCKPISNVGVYELGEFISPTVVQVAIQNANTNQAWVNMDLWQLDVSACTLGTQLTSATLLAWNEFPITRHGLLWQSQAITRGVSTGVGSGGGNPFCQTPPVIDGQARPVPCDNVVVRPPLGVASSQGDTWTTVADCNTPTGSYSLYAQGLACFSSMITSPDGTQGIFQRQTAYGRQAFKVTFTYVTNKITMTGKVSPSGGKVRMP